MDHHRRSHRRRAFFISKEDGELDLDQWQPPPKYNYNYRDQEDSDHLLTLSKPAGYVVHLFAVQAECISTSLLGFVAPFLTILLTDILSVAPSRIARRIGNTVRRIVLGFIGAAYAVAILVAVLAVAAMVGVALVRFWAEEPVFVRRTLHFDCTEAHPSAAVDLSAGVRSRGRAIPAGHTIRVCLELLMPESDYNRNFGVFQVTAEVTSSNGGIIVTSSQPCMLRFRSLPIRLMQTFILSIPLLFGMCSESQKFITEILRYKESSYKITEAIRVRLIPRARTFDLPQIYEADLIVKSKLPWTKELVYNWKWTFYVWISLYVYIMLLIVLFCCFKPFVFQSQRRYVTTQRVEAEKKERLGPPMQELSEELPDVVRRWRERSKRKMKASLPLTDLPELMEGSASSITGGETSEVIEDSGDFAASESSECIGG